MKKRYIGQTNWSYWLKYSSNKPPDGVVQIGVADGNYKADEAMARHYLRLKLKVKRLPKGVYVAPAIGPHG